MTDYVALLIAQRRVSDYARAALPNSPVRAQTVTTRAANPGDAVRRRVSEALWGLAARIEPAPGACGGATFGDGQRSRPN